MRVRTFLAMGLVDLLHLVEADLDRGLALEDVDEHLELLLVGVDVYDLAVEVGERPRGDLDGLAELELDGGPWAVGGGRGRVQDAVDPAASGTGFDPEPTKPVTPACSSRPSTPRPTCPC